MKRIGVILFFLSGGILLALGIAEMTGLSLQVSGGIAMAATMLLLLMIDREPAADPKAATIIRLTRPMRGRKAARTKKPRSAAS